MGILRPEYAQMKGTLRSKIKVMIKMMIRLCRLMAMPDQKNKVLDTSRNYWHQTT